MVLIFGKELRKSPDIALNSFSPSIKWLSFSQFENSSESIDDNWFFFASKFFSSLQLPSAPAPIVLILFSDKFNFDKRGEFANWFG